MKDLTGKAYAASVRIGRACCTAFANGASHGEVIDALESSIRLARINRDMGMPEKALARASEKTEKELSIETARNVAARAWCTPETSGTEMDVALAEAFTDILVENISGITVPQAIGCLSEAMKEPDYAEGWHANIAALLTDEGVEFDAAQGRAASFMKLTFGVDTRLFLGL